MILNIQTGSTFKFLFFLLFLNFIGNWGVFLYSDTNQREKVAIIIPGRGGMKLYILFYSAIVRVIILCWSSLSPIFKEDLPYHLKLFQFFAGKLTDYNINDLSYPETENRTIVFFYGII